MSNSVYQGIWINWTEGPIRGATITLRSRDGNLLISFIATFVTVVGAQLWRILSYLFHQLRSSKKTQDGLHHQQQNILRNITSPAAAAWAFLQQSWYWRGRASALIFRTLPWTVFALLYLILFAVLAIFSSEVSRAAGRARLLETGACGYWDVDGVPGSDQASRAYNQKMANESIVSGTYARACYDGTPEKGQCGRFPVPALKWTSEDNVACPFDPSMCIGGTTGAFRMTSEKIDTHLHLGINYPKRDRIDFRKQTTCTPLTQQRLSREGSNAPGQGQVGDILLEYYYGSIGAGANVITNYTYKYNTHSYIDDFGWVTWSVASNAPHEPSKGYNPTPEMTRNQSDMSIVFIAANSIRFQEMCDDLVFGAHYIDNSTAPRYATDEYVVPVACSEEYQICNPNNGQCTAFIGAVLLINATSPLGLNVVQAGQAARIALASMMTSVHIFTNTRISGSLRAAETAATLIQLPLPANQWHIEVSSWFDAGLARLQHEIHAYAVGPSNISPGSRLFQPGDAVSLAMCKSQMVNDDGTTTSFSVLGLIITFTVGVVIILTSWAMDTVVGWLQSLLRIGEYKKMNWLLDDELQLQRMLLEGLGHGEWEGATGFPVTKQKSKFSGWADVDINHPTLIPRSAGTNSPWAMSRDVIPNYDGTKTTDVFVRERPR